MVNRIVTEKRIQLLLLLFSEVLFSDEQWKSDEGVDSSKSARIDGYKMTISLTLITGS